jgi:hypothetical protein
VEFYAVSAQVIPVLFLAMIFENQVLHQRPTVYGWAEDEDNPRHWNGSQAIARWYLSWVMTVGEGAALVGVYEKEEHGVINGLTTLALLVGVLGVALPIIGRQWGFLKAWMKETDEWWLLAIFLISLVGMTIWWVTLFV